MIKEIFKKELEIASDEIDMKEFYKLLKNSQMNMDNSIIGGRNLIIVQEELAELSKEISKFLRGKGDYTNILEELADVQLGIYTVQIFCNISKFNLDKAMNIKMQRLEKTLKETSFYK